MCCACLGLFPHATVGVGVEMKEAPAFVEDELVQVRINGVSVEFLCPVHSTMNCKETINSLESTNMRK